MTEARWMWRRSAWGVAILWAAAQAAWAVHPQTWTHQAEQDYVDGQFDNVVVDNYGALTLGREVSSVAFGAEGAEKDGKDAKADFVNAFAQTADGTVFFSTSPKGKIYKIVDRKAEVIFTAPEMQDEILSLAVDGKGHLLAALCGDGVTVVRLTPGAKAGGAWQATTLFKTAEADYIWAMRVGTDGRIYLATGPKGKVWEVPAEGGDGKVRLDTGGKNVYSMAIDGKGTLYAGTDGRGLVMRLPAESEQAFILLDAGDVDITSLALDGEGNLYAAASAPDDNAGNGNDSTDTGRTSRPGKDEPLTTEPADPDDAADTAPKAKRTPATKPAGPAGPAGHVMNNIMMPDGFINAADRTPTPADLRAMIARAQRQAMAAKKSAGGSGGRSPQTARGKPGPNAKGGAGAPDDDEPLGNAVYKITPEGTVTPVLHETDTMLSLAAHDGELLVGTGTAGKLYSYRPQEETEALVARVHNENVMSLFSAKDGTVYFGTSNGGQVYVLGKNIAKTGTYLSAVLDAKHTALWGAAALTAMVPAGAKATLETRAGNVEDVKRQEKFWSAWSKPLAAGPGAKLETPAARFLQYRVTLEANEQGATPEVEQVRVAYQVGNLAPKIKDLTVDPPGSDTDEDKPATPKADPGDAAGPDKTTHISWDATDPNKDEMVFRIYYREVTDGPAAPWILLSKDVKDQEYDWNTRSIPDGKYQVKVIASDAPDNSAEDAKSTAEVAPPFLIVNTAPTLDGVKATLDGNKVVVTGEAKAKLCAVTDVRIQVDGGGATGTTDGDWQAAAATDKMFDSPTEGFTATTRPLAVGAHRITVRATDAQGNSGYEAVTVTVK